MTLQDVIPTQTLEYPSLITFPGECTPQLVLERHNMPITDEVAPVCFAPSWSIQPFAAGHADLERNSGIVRWQREQQPSSMMNGEYESLVVLPIGVNGFPMNNFTMSNLSWIAVFTMGRSPRNNDSVWMLADAGAYFLTDGDWDNIPHLEFNQATQEFLPADGNTARALQDGNWQFPGTARNLGFTHTLIPRVTLDDDMRWWRPLDQFGDIRMGFVVPGGGYVTCNGHDPLANQDRSPKPDYNWRIISRPMPTETTTTPTLAPVDQSVTAMGVAEQVTDVALELQRERDALRVKAAGLEAKLEHAKEACRTYTLNNEGCNDGKSSFINATGLWDEEVSSYNVIGVLQGQQRFEITYTAKVSGNYSIVAATEDEAREIFDEMGQQEIDDMVIDLIRSVETPSLTIEYIELSDDQDGIG